MKIAIVDDDERLLKAYRVKLTKSGYDVLTINDGTSAVRQITDEKPNLVILDVLMPGKNGWEILNEIKIDKDLKDIPVILASNIGSPEKEMEAKEAGAEAYLVKSQITLEALLEQIKSILS